MKNGLGILGDNINFFKSRLYNNSVDKKALLSLLKRDYSFEQIKKIKNQIESHPFVRKFFYGNPFPKKLVALGEMFFIQTYDLKKELQLLTLLFTKYSKEINRFIKLKNNYEKFFLLGQYSESEQVLNEIERELGSSIWLIENRFLLSDKLGGLKQNKEYLSYINGGTSNVFITTFAYYFSLKAESNVTAFNYMNKINSFLKEFSGSIKEYIVWKLNFLDNEDNISDLVEILSYESIFSAVDKYLTFIKICQLITFSNNRVDEKDSLKEVLRLLFNIIDDQVLSNLFIVCGIKVVVDFDSNEEVLSVFEYYTNGNYTAAAKECKKIIEKIPTEFCLLEIYVRSLLFLRIPVSFIDDSNSIINQTIEEIYNIYNKNSDTDISIVNISKKVLLLENTTWGIQCFYFLKSALMEDSTSTLERHKYLNSTIINPLFYKAFSNANLSLEYLVYVNNYFKFNVTKLFLIESSVKNTEDINKIDTLEIPNYRKEFYKGKCYQKLGLLDTATNVFEKLLGINLIPMYQYEETLVRLLNCLYLLNKLDIYIEIYTKNYMQNQNLLMRVDNKEIYKRIESDRFKNVSHLIYLPIFYKITNQDNHITNVAVRQFLRVNGLSRPSEIIKVVNNLDHKFTVYLLSEVCIPEVLKYFSNFKGTKDILNERLEICQLLLLINEENKLIYNNEIEKIAQNIVILEGIKQVDESKIYIDEKAIRKYDLKETKSNFTRYVEISDLITKVPLLLVDLVNNKNILLNLPLKKYTEEEIEKSKISDYVKFELFKELFYEVRDAFLFSNKYGLDSYLSTRIRHGTLLGQIRSQFQDEYLITQQDKEQKEYSINNYWSRKLSFLSEELQDEIQRYLADFSLKVDDLTNDLKNNLIQIKTKSQNPLGLFDYSFTPKNLLYLYEAKFKKIDTYETFLDQVFYNLWEQTKINLRLIRLKISTSVKDNFIELLNYLNSNLKSLRIDAKEFQELIRHIITCKTNISSELDKIADWFQINETIVKDFKLETVIDTSIEITNKISKHVKINATRQIKSDVVIRGEFFISLFDLLRIFLENIVRYANLETEDSYVYIKASEENNILNISIKNNLNQNIDVNELKIKFTKKRSELNLSNWAIEKTKVEEGTGFFKAKKILTTDLQNENNEFSFTVNDTNEVDVAIKIHLKSIEI